MIGNLFYQGERQILQFIFNQQDISEYELKMLQYCDVESVLKPTVYRQADQIILSYDITLMEKVIKGQKAEQYLDQLQKLRKTLSEYFLQLEGILISGDYLFFWANRWQFIYLPTIDKRNNQDLDFFAGLFQNNPNLSLQMQMMKENPNLTIVDYLQNIGQRQNYNYR